MTAVVVAAVTAGCGGSGKPPVQLTLSTTSTGGKALVFTATEDKKGASQKGLFGALELRGIDKGAAGASFDHASYIDPNRCLGGTSCEWTVAPDKAGKYEYKVFLLDYVHNKIAGESNGVSVSWAAPPRPQAIKLFVNGKTPPTTPLQGDNYVDFPAGPMQVEAKWTTDARNTGYYVQISVDDKVYARCAAGTTCRVPKKVPLGANEEISWTLELLTTRGDMVTGGFKVCLNGKEKSRST